MRSCWTDMYKWSPSLIPIKPRPSLCWSNPHETCPLRIGELSIRSSWIKKAAWALQWNHTKGHNTNSMAQPTRLTNLSKSSDGSSFAKHLNAATQNRPRIFFPLGTLYSATLIVANNVDLLWWSELWPNLDHSSKTRKECPVHSQSRNQSQSQGWPAYPKRMPLRVAGAYSWIKVVENTDRMTYLAVNKTTYFYFTSLELKKILSIYIVVLQCPL